MNIVILWLFYGGIQLLIATYKDFTNKRLIDERHNYLMTGASLMLLSVYPKNFLYILILFLLITLLFILFKRFKIIGEADIQAISWILLGLGFLSPIFMVWFVLYFSGISLLYAAVKTILVKLFSKNKTAPTPFFIVIFISYILTGLGVGYYLL